MADHIEILKSGNSWTVRAGGAVLAETSNALELNEGSMTPVVYFPRDDIAMAFLDRTDKVTHCPHKGDATHFSVVTKSRTLENVAWSYENPTAGTAQIKDHVAFYPVDEVTVEKV